MSITAFNKTSGKQRLYYIDWLRVLAFGLLFVFHSARPFDSFPFHIKNADHSELLDLLIIFSHNWRMHLIFLVSGAGTWFALRARKRAFISDRVKRLIVPFVFGVILLIPVQKFYESISFNNFNGSLLSFYSNYHNIIFNADIGFSLSWFGHLGHHIWYLAFLFVMTLAVLPLLIFIIKKRLSFNFLFKLAQNPIGIFLFVIPIFIAKVMLKPIFRGYLDWADFFIYLSFFLYGFVLIINSKFVEEIKKRIVHFLVGGLLTTSLMIYSVISFNEITIQWFFNPEFNKVHLLASFITSINTFCWVMFFVGISARYLNFKISALQPLNDCILPTYILHQSVIVVLGFYIVQFESSIFNKFSLILGGSLLVTYLIYELIIRIDMLRFLFGMKKRNDNLKMKNNKLKKKELIGRR